MAYLTIDDAPSGRFEEKLDFLMDRGIPAIFFCTGSAIPGREPALARALASGYLLGNHSYSHPRFSQIPFEKCVEEIERTDLLITKLHASALLPWTRKYFRFPYFDRGGSPEAEARLQALLVGLGYSYSEAQGGRGIDVVCDFDQREYELLDPASGPGPDEREAILARIDASHPSSSDVILIHDHEGTHELFCECVDRYLSYGIRFEPFR